MTRRATLQGKSPVRAKLGEENKFVFDDKVKLLIRRWRWTCYIGERGILRTFTYLRALQHAAACFVQESQRRLLMQVFH